MKGRTEGGGEGVPYRVGQKNVLNIRKYDGNGFLVEQWKHTGVEDLLRVNIVTTLSDTRRTHFDNQLEISDVVGFC